MTCLGQENTHFRICSEKNYDYFILLPQASQQAQKLVSCCNEQKNPKKRRVSESQRSLYLVFYTVPTKGRLIKQGTNESVWNNIPSLSPSILIPIYSKDIRSIFLFKQQDGTLCNTSRKWCHYSQP